MLTAYGRQMIRDTNTIFRKLMNGPGPISFSFPGKNFHDFANILDAHETLYPRNRIFGVKRKTHMKIKNK